MPLSNVLKSETRRKAKVQRREALLGRCTPRPRLPWSIGGRLGARPCFFAFRVIIKKKRNNYIYWSARPPAWSLGVSEDSVHFNLFDLEYFRFLFVIVLFHVFYGLTRKTNINIWTVFIFYIFFLVKTSLLLMKVFYCEPCFLCTLGFIKHCFCLILAIALLIENWCCMCIM